jgi:hypothetical protein
MLEVVESYRGVRSLACMPTAGERLCYSGEYAPPDVGG